MTYAEASALIQVDDDRFEADIPAGWDIMGNTNGGFLLSIAAQAARRVTGRSDPVTISGHFLERMGTGPVTIEVSEVRSGRRFSVARMAMRNDAGKPVLAALGTFTDLRPPEGPERIDSSPPDLPPVDECVPVEPTETFPPPFMGKVELRLHPEDVPFFSGPKNNLPRVRGWFRWRSREPLDTTGLIVASDAFPPTIFNANLPVAWTPTIELTVHVREQPPPTEWLRCSFTTRFISNGYLEEDGELWDVNGRLAAQSRQLALVPKG